jgi:diaminohydroxyphosphoribosylaminopyrimidine deaminase/5-amino-6-(5-phosphoribosylamino)uracil reductase
MARALRLAARGLYTTQPNPRVGCVIARDDAIVGEGWHRHAGGPHAEIFALRAAGETARGATAYVTLEPCSHHGRTPPCADALIEAGIARIVVASPDPNPKVASAGLRRLRQAAIAIEAGLLRAAARELNRGFFSRFERERPWVRVKLAMSLDGRTALANGDAKWITGAAARADGHRWRARSSAILTGAGTARMDDPRLTVRLTEVVSATSGRGVPEAGGDDSGPPEPAVSAEPSPLPRSPATPDFRPSPLRVVLDARLDALPARAHLLDGAAPTLVLHAPEAQPHDERYRHAERAAVPVDARGRIDLDAALRLLAARGVNELQVEAGPSLCGALLERGLVDELLLYLAPTLLGDAALPLLRLAGPAAMAARRNWQTVDDRRVGPDRRILLRPA